MRGLRLLCYSFAVLFVFLGMLFAGRPVLAEETIKLAYTDPFSGPFASGGDEFLKVFQFIIARRNAAGGALGRKFELVPFDNKSQPSEALIALKSATDQNMPFIMQCSGSNIAAALIDARLQAQRAQSRQPHPLPELRRGRDRADQRAVQLLAFPLRPARRHEGRGEDQCAAEGRQEGLPAQPGLPVRPVGPARHQEMAGQAAARRRGRRRRVDPARQGARTSAPYITKIKASGAQSAAHRQLGPRHEPPDQGRRSMPALDVRYDTFLCPPGRRADRDRRGRRKPAAVGDGVQRERGAGRSATTGGRGFAKAGAPSTSSTSPRPASVTIFEMLQAAINKAGSIDPTKIALALEDLHVKDLARLQTP